MEENNKNRFQSNSKYFTICVYVLATLIVGAIAFKCIMQFSVVMTVVGRVLQALSPYLIGIFIAYLLNSLVKQLDIFMVNYLHLKNRRLRKVLSITFSYILVFGVIIVCMIFIVPQVAESVKTIYQNSQNYYDKLLDFVKKESVKHPEIDFTQTTAMLEKNSTTLIGFAQNSLSKLLPFIFTTSLSVIQWVYYILVAIIVSIYMLIDRDRLLNTCRKAIYAILKKEKADSLIYTLSQCNRIFGGFIIGKAIDSIIIGIMCFAFMSILGLKYAVLISVIVGITNMIPYFGPFIGAIPGVLILLTSSFQEALIFAILILALQQFDGLYLGPKILGDSTGLRPLWIIFAITFGGWLAGPLGMFLGVPCVAVISYLIDTYVTKKLTEKHIQPEDYEIKEDYYITPKKPFKSLFFKEKKGTASQSKKK